MNAELRPWMDSVGELDATRTCLVVVPAYNEASRLASAEIAVLVSDRRVGVLLVDDGSSDGTWLRMQDIANSVGLEKVRCLRMAKNGGKAEAVRQGMNEALRSGAECVGFLDADGATPALEMHRLLRGMQQENLDAVLGCRLARLGARIDRSYVRHLLGRVFATMASLALAAPVYDTQCGAKWFRNTPALLAALDRPFETRWVFDVELIARLLGRNDRKEKLDYEKLVEFPLRSWRDVEGSKLGLRSQIRSMLDVMRLVFLFRL